MCAFGLHTHTQMRFVEKQQSFLSSMIIYVIVQLYYLYRGRQTNTMRYDGRTYLTKMVERLDTRLN